MSDFSRDSKSKITLEEILKLKRKERPPAEFWEAFDRDLRRRTLQALVNDEPWYGRYLGSALGRILASIPLSAAVVATLGFIIYRIVLTSRKGCHLPQILISHSMLLGSFMMNPV